MKRNGKKAKALKPLKAYVVVDQDPLIELLCFAQRQAKMKDVAVIKGGGPSSTTLRNWRNGKTRRCMVQTAASTALVMGMDSLPITPAARKRFREDLKLTAGPTRGS